MENVINSLENNLKELYRKAIDADKSLVELKKQGHGKFTNVFTNSKLFTAQSDKFMPYLEETAELILKLKNSDQNPNDNQQQIELIVKQLHSLHTTLSGLQQLLKSK